MKRPRFAFWALLACFSLSFEPIGWTYQEQFNRTVTVRSAKRSPGDPTLHYLLAAPVQTRLGLTAEQKSKLAKLDATTREKMQSAIAFNGAGFPATVAGRVAAIQAQAAKDALAVLKPAQNAAFRPLKQEIDGRSGLGKAGLALVAVTGLTSAQSTRLRELAAATGKAPGPGPVSAGGVPDLEGMMKAIREQADRTTEDVRSILAAPQRAQFDSSMKSLGPDSSPIRAFRRSGPQLVPGN
jgi:hypothetical protein